MNVLKIDFTDPNAPRQLAKSFRETGFAVLTNHTLPKDLMKEFYEGWAAFFASNEKKEYLFNREDEVQAGFFPMHTETAKGESVPDLKEFYHFYLWGKAPEALRATSTALFTALNEIGVTLLSWLDQETPKEISSAYCMPLTKMIENSKSTLLRIIHYPPLTGREAAGAVRAAAHGDINFITLLPAATEAGLQTQDVNGNWHDVSCEHGDIAINAGDMLQECSQGYYPSTTHRVLNPAGEKMAVSRFSSPLFVHPRSEIRLSERYTVLEYFRERLTEIGLH